MKRKRTPARDEPGGINLIPVLGIAFLLVLFIVAAVPFARERGIDFSNPWWSHGYGCGAIVISVDSQDRISVENDGMPREIDVRSVRSTVARRLAEYPRCGVLVKAHRRSSMGTVVRVVDEAKLARNRPPVAVQLVTVD